MHLTLAPIKGFTEAPYRNAAADFFQGFDSAMAPFVVTIQGRKYPDAHLKDLLPENNRGWPVVPQILSNHVTACPTTKNGACITAVPM